MALERESLGGTTRDMRTCLIAFIASVVLAACGGDEERTNATNDDDPQSSPTVAK